MVDYTEFNRALDNLIGGSAEISAQPCGKATAWGTGRVIVQVTTANGSLPIKGAKVTVSDTEGNIIAERITDSSGRTEAVELAVPAASYSQQPGNVTPYSVYNLLVEYPGFYNERFLNVAVFDKIDSIQPVTLIPLGEDSAENDGVVVDEESGNGLPDA